MPDAANPQSGNARTTWPDPIPGLLPFGTLTIFAGAPGVGKTTMLLEWLRRWRDGRTICTHPTTGPTWVYYVCADRGLLREDFYALAGFSEQLSFYSVVSADSGLNVDDLQKSTHGKDLLRHVLTALQPIPGSHLIIDPISPLFISGSPNAQRDVAASLIRLSRTIEEYQINITGTAHFGKQKADKNDRYRRPQDRISGSGAFSGYSDTQIYLVDPEVKQPYYLLGWNPRYSKPEEHKFTREQWFVPYIGLDDVGVDPDRPTQIAELLPVDGLRYTEWSDLAQHTFSISERTFERAFALLKDRGIILKDDDGRWHRITPPHWAKRARIL
jgi:hypothetical protein